MIVYMQNMGAGYLKKLGIRFRVAGAYTKTWEECIIKVRQKLGFWEHCSLSIAGKNLVIRSKMDHVDRDTMYKTLDKGGKNVPSATLILMATFTCGCIKLCVDPQKRSAHNVLKTLREKERQILSGCSLSRLSKSFDRMLHHQNFPTSTKTLFGW
eukprot:g39257.t1